MPVRVLIADASEIAILGLRCILGDVPRVEVVGEARDAAEALRLLPTLDPDLLYLDVRMPGMSGVEFLRQAKARYPHTVRMVLSGYTELQSVTDAINEGAIYKFLTKPWDDDLLREQIREAFRLVKSGSASGTAG